MNLDPGATMVSPRASAVQAAPRPVACPPPPPVQYAGSVPASPVMPTIPAARNNTALFIILGVVLLTVCCCVGIFLWVDSDPNGARWCQFPFSLIAQFLKAYCP